MERETTKTHHICLASSVVASVLALVTLFVIDWHADEDKDRGARYLPSRVKLYEDRSFEWYGEASELMCEYAELARKDPEAAVDHELHRYYPASTSDPSGRCDGLSDIETLAIVTLVVCGTAVLVCIGVNAYIAFKGAFGARKVGDKKRIKNGLIFNGVASSLFLATICIWYISFDSMIPDGSPSWGLLVLCLVTVITVIPIPLLWREKKDLLRPRFDIEENYQWNDPIQEAVDERVNLTQQMNSSHMGGLQRPSDVMLHKSGGGTAL